jgi:hypothetical protein
MSRSVFLLIMGLYTTLSSLLMIVVPAESLKSYGALSVDLTHIAAIQFLGVAAIGEGILALLSRNAPNYSSLRHILLAITITTLGGVLLGVYHIVVLHPPMNSFFIGDTVFRLLLGLATLYYYNQATKQAVA